MKVKVVKKNDSDNWYKKGSIYNIVKEEGKYYLVSAISGILKEDSVIINCKTCRYNNKSIWCNDCIDFLKWDISSMVKDSTHEQK